MGFVAGEARYQVINFWGRYGGGRFHGVAGEESPAFAFPDKVSDKGGEEHYIVDHTGHFLSDRKTVNEGIAEGHLKYSGYQRINGKVRHIYYLVDPPLME